MDASWLCWRMLGVTSLLGARAAKAHDIADMQAAELRVQLRRRAIGSSVLPCSHDRATALLRWVHQSDLLMSSSNEAIC